MEKICRINRLFFSTILFGVFVSACSTKQIMEDTKTGPTDIDHEFGEVVKVKDIKETKKNNEVVEQVSLPMAQPDTKKSASSSTSSTSTKSTSKSGSSVKSTSSVKGDVSKTNKTESKDSKAKAHLPALEDGTGFIGRRPVDDPFRAGEKVVLTAKYLNVEAGDITLEVLPFKIVNDRKAYHFKMNIKTNKTFNMFYAVNNTSETYLDYEDMIPQTYTYDAKESNRIREYKIFFDTKKNEATQWRREVHKKKGEKKSKVTWPIEPYTQNLLSALYYMRVFQLEPGKKYSYRVADEGKNFVFTLHVIKREKLETPKGVINTLVIRPDYQVDGVFKPSGENTIWVTDDNRKFMVQMAAKFKIGTFMLKLKSIEGPK